MQWLNRRQSGNVEDRRGFSGGKLALGGGVIGIIIYVLQLFMGGDATQLLNQVQQDNSQQTAEPLSAEEQESGKFIAVLLADNEDVWNKLFSEMGHDYVEPKLVLFRNATTSGCGNASSASGPFIARPTKKYIWTLFFLMN